LGATKAFRKEGSKSKEEYRVLREGLKLIKELPQKEAGKFFKKALFFKKKALSPLHKVNPQGRDFKSN